VQGGHFDVDTDKTYGGSTDGHIHEYDEKFNTTMIGEEYQRPNQTAIKREMDGEEEMASDIASQQPSLQTEAEPSKDEMSSVFALLRNNHWNSCLSCLRTKPLIGVTNMVMGKSVCKRQVVLHVRLVTSKKLGL
jgi:hypothetical protein